jgi:hypothetical protein
MIMLAQAELDERAEGIEQIYDRIHGLNEMAGLHQSPEAEYDEAEETYDALMISEDNPRLWPVVTAREGEAC